MTSLKGVSSMKLHRDIGVTQKTAWFMLNRIREAFKHDDDDGDQTPMSGPAECDEMLVGGSVRNMSKFSIKHLQRYVTDFAGRHGIRTSDTLAQMEFIAKAMVGKRLTYKALKADNGLPSGARRS